MGAIRVRPDEGLVGEQTELRAGTRSLGDGYKVTATPLHGKPFTIYVVADPHRKGWFITTSHLNPVPYLQTRYAGHRDFLAGVRAAHARAKRYLQLHRKPLGLAKTA